MDSKEKQVYVNEIKYQIRMLNNLKRWLRNLMIVSSVALILILFGNEFNSLVSVAGIVLMGFSVTGFMAVGLALRNGKANVNKLINYLEK